MGNLQAETRHHEWDVQLNGRVPSLVLSGSAITGPLANCGHLSWGALKHTEYPRSRGWSTPLTEGLFWHPVTSGSTPECLQDSGLPESAPILSCRHHEGLDPLGETH